MHRQRGAVLPVLLFTCFALVGAFYVVHTLGWKVADRMTAQQSADRAAYSAAAVNARSLNMIEHLNSAMVAVRAVESIYGSVQENYGPLMQAACGICAATGSQYHCTLCSRMSAKSGPVMSTIQSVGQKLSTLGQEIDTLGNAVVDGTPKWAADTAERIAKANGATRAWAHPRDQDKLPFSDDPTELRTRTLQIANRLYQNDVEPLDRQYIWGGFFTRPAFTAGIAQKASQVSGPYWVPDYGTDRTAMRHALVQTVFTAVPQDNQKRLDRMVAAGVRDAQSAFGNMPEVAVARAEPYFTLNGGTPDGRPGWSARLRPNQIDNQSRQTLAEAANQAGFVGEWRPAFAAGFADAKIPH